MSTEVLDRSRGELENLRAGYLAARKMLADPAAAAAPVERVLELLAMYHGDPLERAAWILGQIKEALRPLELARKAIKDYESKQQSHDRLREASP